MGNSRANSSSSREHSIRLPYSEKEQRAATIALWKGGAVELRKRGGSPPKRTHAVRHAGTIQELDNHLKLTITQLAHDPIRPSGVMGDARRFGQTSMSSSRLKSRGSPVHDAVTRGHGGHARSRRSREVTRGHARSREAHALYAPLSGCRGYDYPRLGFLALCRRATRAVVQLYLSIRGSIAAPFD
jgi:hypothetical protein